MYQEEEEEKIKCEKEKSLKTFSFSCFRVQASKLLTNFIFRETLPAGLPAVDGN
jgi:hypothetical protein